MGLIHTIRSRGKVVARHLRQTRQESTTVPDEWARSFEIAGNRPDEARYKLVMMDPAVKTAMALCVLLAGVCTALLFRRAPDQPAPPAPSVANQLLIRYRTPSPALRRRAAARQTPAERDAPTHRPATVVTPFDRYEPPPSLAHEYPETRHPANSRWGMSMDMVLPVATSSDETVRTHGVVDGDTLASLAQRYLGSTLRADEIHELNRDLLPNPKLLPIGLELKIPPRKNRPAPHSARPPCTLPTRSLMPAAGSP